MARQKSGLVAEAYRQRQRQLAADRRAWNAAQEQQQKAYRASRRAALSEHKAAMGAYLNLYEMDPVRFEDLVAELFRPRGLRVMTTERSGDGGTTSGFGPGSHDFAQGKPLTLISGPELVGLLAEHRLPGRLG